jgi:PAT family beta-lactamase induction signal transducer AmpG
LGDIFGKRRGWLIGSQVGLVISIYSLGLSDPANNLTVTAICAITVALFSSVQDIVYEAYRIEILKGPLAGYGVGASVIGYRIGLLVAGAGSIYIKYYFDWQTSYTVMSLCMTVGIVTSILIIEPNKEDTNDDKNKKDYFNSLLISPIKILLKKENIIFILVFLITYKTGDTILNAMSAPFLLEIGFSEIEIANVAKSFGIVSMILGGFIGGILLAEKSLQYVLLLSAVSQIVASLMFLFQSLEGYNVFLLFITMGIENFVCGLSQTALISYIANLCYKPFTATHYALLSSLGSLTRILLSSISGWATDQISWNFFYLFVAVGCIPSLILIHFFKNKFMTQFQKTILINNNN